MKGDGYGCSGGAGGGGGACGGVDVGMWTDVQRSPSPAPFICLDSVWCPCQP